MKTLFSIAFVAAIFVFATPATAQLHIGVGIRIGPPPAPKEEVVVTRPPHRGWVWIPGNYEWRSRHHKYVWVKGHWIKPPRAHAVWIPGRWEQRNNEWVYFEGRWDSKPRNRR